MADWTFYSPKIKMATAGELLRAIPSTRIWRLERSFVEDGEDTRELVRAAEQLLDLDVTLRLQNDPAAAIRLHVRLPTDADRRQFTNIGYAEFGANDITVVADIALEMSAIRAGHLDVADDLIAALDGVFRRGVAHSAQTGELLVANDVARLLHSETARCSHIDVKLHCDRRAQEYVARQFAELPPPFGQLMRRDGDAVMLRARFPPGLSDDEINAVCSVAMAMARHANGGHVRFRERGSWRHVIDNVGSSVQPLPTDQSEGMFGRLTRLLRSK